MIEKKKIDRLFQEKFKDFEIVPDENVWQNIEAELNKKKKRRVIPFWFRLAGAAAILILGGLLLYKLAFSPNDMHGRIVNEDKNPPGNTAPNHPRNIQDRSQKTSGDAVASGSINENTGGNGKIKTDRNEIRDNGKASEDRPQMPQHRQKSRNAVAETDRSVKKHRSKATISTNSHLLDKHTDQSGENAIVNASDEKRNGNPANKLTEPASEKDSLRTAQNLGRENRLAETSSDPNSPKREQINAANQSNDKKPAEQNTGIAENADTKKDSTAIATVAPNALEELLNEKENNVTAKEQKVNRWQITSNIAPIYFSSTSNGSPLDPRFESNKKTYAPSVSYGIGAKYAVGKKFFIKSGVNSVSLEYNTSDVIFFQTENARKIENVSPNIQGSLIQVDNMPIAGVSTLGRTIRQFSGDLSQRISYVEIPVEMSYQLFSRKFGIELIGGLSTLVLNKNEVSLVSSGMDMTIGEADNLNRLHFSTNVGVGFKYNFLKRFEANFEPMFKYQINTFTNDAGNFKPYFFGLYTGVSYRF